MHACFARARSGFICENGRKAAAREEKDGRTKSLRFGRARIYIEDKKEEEKQKTGAGCTLEAFLG
jgi:hypothetical protein